MVDLNSLEVPPRKWREKTTRQHAIHLTDEANTRLDRAAEISGRSRSVVLHNLIMQDIHLPEDAPRREMIPVPQNAETQLQVAAIIAERDAPKKAGLAALVPDPNVDSFKGNARARLPLHANDSKRPAQLDDGEEFNDDD